MSSGQNMLHISMQACAQRVDRINLVIEEGKFVMALFASIENYMARKGLESKLL